MNFPTNVKYTNEHEWIRLEGEEAYVGITDYAQDQLGDIVFVDIPTEGETLEKGAGKRRNIRHDRSCKDRIRLVPSHRRRNIGSKSGIGRASGTGKPRPVRQRLAGTHGKGWLVRIKPTDASELDELLDAEAYKQLINE